MLSFNVSPSNRAGGGQPNQNMGTTPLERIRVLVSKKGIIGVQVPFQTPRAQSVRQFMHARLLNESNQKMFIWRREPNNLWTNISLHSTPESPELTAAPVDCIVALTTILVQCPDVGEVNLYDESDKLLTIDEAKSMQFEDPSSSAMVPVASPNSLPPLPPVNMEVVAEKVNQVANKLDELAIATKSDIVQFRTNVELKLGYIIDVLDGKNRARDTYDLGTQPSGEPGSSATNMQIEEVNESVAGDQATAKRPSRSSKAEGKKKQKA